MSWTEEFDIRAADSPSIDAFGRWRVSELTTFLDLKQLHDSQPLLVDIVTSGTGADAHSTTNAATTISTAAASDYVVAQTYQRFNYQSAKSHLIFLTFSDFHVQTNVEKRMGYFSSSTVAPYTGSYDGIFLENDGTDIRLRVYREGTSTLNVAQSSFNLDPLDGTGDSGVTIDWEKGNIFVIDFEWLGVGRVRCGVVVDGALIYFHEMNNANSVDNVYMSTPNQPCRWEIRQAGAGSGTFDYICASVNSEGGRNLIGKIRSVNADDNDIQLNSAGTLYAAIGLRLQTTHKDGVIDFLEFDYLAETNDRALWEIRLNPTVTGTFAYTAVSDSCIEAAVGNQTAGAAPTASGGTVIDSGYLQQSASERIELRSAIKLGTAIDGTADELVLCIKPINAGLDAYTAFTWRESV